MQIEIKIDETCTSPKITIETNEMTDEINELVKKISEQPTFVLAGFKNSEVTVLELNQVIHIYAANQKVYAVTDHDEYTLRLRIYEIEERLNPLGFYGFQVQKLSI